MQTNLKNTNIAILFNEYDLRFYKEVPKVVLSTHIFME